MGHDECVEEWLVQAVMSSYGGAIEHHNGENIIIIIHLFFIAQFLSQLKFK